MNRRELLTGVALLGSAAQANAFGIGRLGLGEGRLGALGGAGKAAAPVTPFLGNIATRTMVPNNNSSSVVNLMSRHWHFSRNAVSSVQLVIPNFAAGLSTSHVEVINPGTTTVTAAIEYPQGTITQLKFSGLATGTTTAAFVLTDALPISIPAGAMFFTRIFLSNTTGGLSFNTWGVGTFTIPGISAGDNFNFATTGNTIPDQTMSPTVSNVASWSGTNNFGPIAILAQITTPSIYLVGDSRVAGAGDSFDASGDLGELARSIGPSFAYINAGSEGDNAFSWVPSHAARLSLAQYCSHVIVEYGVNDVTAGQTSAQVIANRSAILGMMGNKPVFETTLPTESSSTDNWTTTANQTASANPSVRQAFNTSVRAHSVGMAGFFDIASVTDTTLSSSIWNADGVTANKWTPDGVHESQFAAVAIKTAGVINPALFTIAPPPPLVLWTPLNDPGLVAWFDPTDSAHITLNGSNVSAWTDRSAQHTASQATSANQPPIGASSINSIPVLTFSGTTDILATPAFLNPARYTVVGLAQVPNTTATGAGYLGADNGSTGRQAQYLRQDTNTFHSISFNTAGGPFTAVSPATVIAATPIIVGTMLTASNVMASINGSDGTPAAVSGTNQSQSVPITLGQVTVGPGIYTGLMGDLIFTATSTGSTKQKMEGFVAWKYGLQGSLPAGHPYKSRAPRVGDP